MNDTPQMDSDRGFFPEVAVYDAGFSVAIDGARVVPSEYRVVERDYRTEPLVHAHGRFCCLDEDAFTATGELRTTTLPVHRQMVYESKPELQPSFAELTTDPIRVLERIEQHMSAFGDSWDRYLDTTSLSGSARRACEADRAAFADEARRYRRGLELIRSDLAGPSAGLGAAFVRANEAFALMNTHGGLDDPGKATATTWRLFQIVYVVANLAALSAREVSVADRLTWQRHRGTAVGTAQDLGELDVADVLWFPTGGGKSAALYGLIAVALFYDRLRGKDAGTTAIVRFPLRMLSVQQLERVMRLVAACELVRDSHGVPGGSFRLGYWVGRTNTPNRITNPADERWHDVAWMARQSTEWKRDNTVLPSCPYCGGSRVTLDPDPQAVRLVHRCGDCNKELPVDVTDDEVYRHLPAVLVSTVDKIASLAFNAHASHLTHGPAFRCPDHGFVTYPQGRNRRCIARDTCTRTPSEWIPVSIKDPAPALVVQDELHLLSEELGTFAAHYETLWQHLCTVGSGLPSKVLAATATISDYENQVTQLYALTPRRFPTDGWTDGESFYAKRHDDLVRRVFVGALPTQMDVVQFAIAAGEVVRNEVARLGSIPPDVAAKTLRLAATAPTEVADLLFQYELQCFYCNRKTHADRVHARAERVGRDGPMRFQSVRLNGQTRLAEISEVIRRVERETLATLPENRLGSIAGTSLISHGVDLERLNVLFVLGMPSTVAYYVQATSRAGRTDVGIVFTGLTRHYVRDRSVFHFFDAQHRYVNVLVEPVALNRFSTHGPRKTVSGILAAILTQQWARDPTLLSMGGLTMPTDLSRAETTRRLLTRLRTQAATDGGPAPVQLAQEAARAAYGLRAAVLDAHVARRFTETVDLQVASVLASVEAAHESLLTRSMRPPPPTSLRDVDASADFGAASYLARRRFEFLGVADYDDDETDYAVADEEE
ncbi:helicase-related protein [Actinomadura geliboluensis]